MNPVYVIAEIGLCHDGDWKRACRMIALARNAGADFAKFQKRSDPAWFNDPTPRDVDRWSHPHAVDCSTGAHRTCLEFTAGQHTALCMTARMRDIGYMASVWDAQAAVEVGRVASVLKIGRPTARDENRFTEVCAALAALAEMTLVVSCRDEDEANYASAIAGGYHHKVAPIWCPGEYPDRAEDLVCDPPAWCQGISLHTPDPQVFVRMAKARPAEGRSFFVEAHVRLPETQHSDREYSLSFDDLAIVTKQLTGRGA